MSWLFSDAAVAGWLATTSKFDDRFVFVVYQAAGRPDTPPPAGMAYLPESAGAYVDVDEDADNETRWDTKARPKSWPKTEAGFQKAMQRLHRCMIRQERLRLVMRNRALARFPTIDEATFDADPMTVSFLRNDP